MDLGHKQTDAMLKDMEKRIQKVYAQAARETQAKTLQYFSSYADRYNKKVAELNAGKISKDEFQQWCRTNIMTGKRWQEMHDTIATDLANSDKLAISMINGYTPDVYALNHNYGTYEVEHGAMVDTSYTLYDRQTVERLIKDDPKLIPHPKLNENRDIRWNKQRFNNGIVQGILQGESIPNIARRVALGTASSDYKAAVRNARTATTGAENAGRLDSYERAEKMGIKIKKVWMATLDSRTRDSHALLDGEEQAYDKPFSNNLMYPGDTESKADPSEVWNCRCTLVADVDGTPSYDMSDTTWRNNKLDGMSYDEWKDAHREQEGQAKPPQDEPSFVFTPAKTLEEAEAYISQYVDNSRFGALGVSYKGVSVDVANEINRTIGEFYTTYDVEKFGGIIAPAGNTKYGKQIQGATAAYSDIRRSFFLNRNSLKTKDIALKTLQKEQDAVKGVLAHPEKYDIAKMSTRVRLAIENAKESGRATIPATISEVINHELGHSLQKQVFASDLWEQAKQNIPKYNKKVSGYACDSVSEYIAESFCSYSKGESIIDPVLVNIFESLRRK